MLGLAAPTGERQPWQGPVATGEQTKGQTVMETTVRREKTAYRGPVGGGLFRSRSEANATKPQLHCTLQGQCIKINSHILPPH